tara:strand:- start:212 stop:478 length:267 start_codon:yes stop_codon:yes gene_type:complete
MKHTQGPWHFERHPINHTCEIHDANGCFGTVHRDSAELISASPEMLSALQVCQDAIQRLSHGIQGPIPSWANDALIAARAAIAKATNN